MELPSFTWDENVFDSPGISTGGQLESLALAQARVLFTSNLDPKAFLLYQGNSQRPPITVHASVDENGQVVDKNGYPPRLLANDPGLSVTGIQWKREVFVPAPGGTLVMYPITFLAANDNQSVGPATAIVVAPLPPVDDDELIIDGTPE